MSDPILRTKKDLDEMFGRLEPSPQIRSIGGRFNAAYDELPSANEMANKQFVEAMDRADEDATNYPQFPWPELAELAGPICPQDLLMVAARTGGGKSLFLQNLFNALVTMGRTGLYVGLEQTPGVLRIKWACLRVDVAPKLILAPRDWQVDSEEYHDARRRVDADLKWQKSPEIRALAHFADTRKIDARGLRQWVTWAVDYGCEYVIVDHIDRIQHGDGKNSFHEMSETVRLAKELAVEHRIAMIVASQVGRPADALAQFMPPSLHEMRGGGTKEEEADTVIGIYRPLRASVSDGELKQVRQGLRDRDLVIEPNVMGLMLLKHRLDGPVAGKVVKLAVRHQRVESMPERDRWTTGSGSVREVL